MIATHGGQSLGAIRAQSEGGPMRVPVEPLAPENFVDDVGAGDAFMGGFLAATWMRLASLGRGAGKENEAVGGMVSLLSDADIEAAAKAGSSVARAVLQHVGCQFPPEPEVGRGPCPL